MDSISPLQPIKITPDMTNEEADVKGVLSFSQEMNAKLTKCRETGKQGWHQAGTMCATGCENEIPAFKIRMQKAMDEGRMIDVANYAMMIYHREKMETKEA